MISGLKVEATGVRREEHPKGFRSIALVFRITSNDLNEEAVMRILRMAEETYCPVWNDDTKIKWLLRHLIICRRVSRCRTQD